MNFLDLTIRIEGSRIQTKTYQKSMNLYQYIMPQSNHPRRMMKGIIFSLLRNYHRQNSKFDDYKRMAHLLFQRHVDRGWDRELIRSWILEADSKIQSQGPTPRSPPPTLCPVPPDDNQDARLFLHLEYHRGDITKAQVRRLYDAYCKDVFETELGITQLTIAYSRPTNLQELLTKGHLHQAPGQEASTFMGELQPP